MQRNDDLNGIWVDCTIHLQIRRDLISSSKVLYARIKYLW